MIKPLIRVKSSSILIGSLTYLLSAFVSIFLFRFFDNNYTVWLPIGVGLGLLVIYGKSVLPSLFLAMLASHFFAYNIPLDTHKVYLLQPTVSAAFELMVIFSMSKLISAFNVVRKSNGSIQKLGQMALIYLSSALVLALFLTFLNYKNSQINSASFFALSYVGFVFSLLAITPLILSTQSTSKVLKDAKKGLLVILASVLLGLVPLLPAYSEHLQIAYIVTLIIFGVYLIAEASIFVFSVALAIISISSLAAYINTNQITSIAMLWQITAFYSMALFISYYLHKKVTTISLTSSSLISPLTQNNEANRQANEYKKLTDQLFIEVEKRAKAEREAEDSKTLLAEAQGYSGIATWEYSPQTERISWVSHNPNVPVLDFNIEHENIESIALKLHPADLNIITEHIKRNWHTDSDFDLEIRIRNNSNRYGYYMLKGRSFVDDKKKTRVVGLVMNITQRKKDEQKLIENEEKFRVLFESNIDAVCIIDAQTHLVKDVNNAFLKTYGYAASEIIGQPYLKLSAQPEYSRTSLEIAKKQGHSHIAHRLHTKKNNEVISVEANFISQKINDEEMLFIIAHDITDRKRYEQQLTENRAQLKQAQAVAKLGSIRYNPENELITLSNEALEIFGFDTQPPQLTRKDILSMVLPGASLNFNEILTKLELGDGVNGSHEIAITSNLGEVIYLSLNFGTTLLPNGKLKEVLITLADISKIKQTEIALQEANALKDQLFSIISHDLRSPISSINQLIEMLQSQWHEYDKETIVSILQTLSTTSSETYKLLENLLQWSHSQRMESFNPKQIDLNTIIDEVITLKTVLASNKDILIEKEVVPNAFVFIDADMMKTVLRNLVSNSIKFTPNKGKIIIQLKEVASDYIISVIDSGIGISHEVLSTLFDGITTISTPGTNSEKGTGLGLKLVKKFVDKNNGKISANSTAGKGSTFSFTLPRISA
ncbi:MAG: PAS domain-containing sensor histidine kinase [Bacteroidales bacterium]|nr:PAS domain-containing sensor histidine kinase [Tenuifilaceae bacterium]